MSVFWFFGPFFDYFFIVQSFKNEILSKILDIQKYNIVRHWLSSKNWIFAIFFKKVSIDGFTHYSMENITPNFQKIDCPKYPNIWLICHQKSYDRYKNTTLCTTLIFLIKIEKLICVFWFLSPVSIDGFTHFSSKIHPKFSKNRTFIIYPWNTIIQHCDQTFYARSNNQTIRIFAIKIEKVSIERSLHIIYGPFFDYFFYCPKFQKWNFIKNPWYTKIQHCTTLIFLKKLDFCDFF